MKKIFFLAAAMLAAVTMNAQRIEFSEVIATADFGAEKVFTNGDVELICTNVPGKMAVDENKTKFGTSLEDYWQSTHRFKTGGKTNTAEGKELGLVLYVPAEGVVNIYARSGSSSETRSIVIMQDEKEVFNHAFVDTEATSDKVFPVFTSEKVTEGEMDIIFADGAMYIFAIEFVPETETALDNTAVADKAQKVVEDGQVIIIRNGVRYNALGAIVE